MSSVFRPTTVADEASIIEFLTRVFSVDRDAPFLNPSLLRWKYWEPRGDWPGPRSFAMERDGRIVAHAGLWPVTVRTGENCARGVHMIDWASDPKTPGAGVSLLQRLTQNYDFVYSIGGSEMTQSILPKFGFRHVANASTFARPIRPWRQILQHQSRDMRLPLRLARNIWWSRTPAGAPMGGWTSAAAAPGDVPGPPELTAERDGRFLQYLQKCPSARVLAFHILNRGRKSGFFALSVVGEQARVAGVWLENPDPGPAFWRIALHLAQHAALSCSAASEIVTRGTAESCSIAAAQAGMRLRAQTPVFLFRKGGSGDLLPLQFQMCDNDSVFLESGRTAFLT